MKMRSLPTVAFKVEKWNPATGSNGALDVAWFRIKGIPYEKKILFMLCRIYGGLPLEVDKENLSKNNFVRVKIGCRDVTKVPAVVDGLLNLHWYDYSFQREVAQEGYTNVAGIKWIRVEGEKDKEDKPSPKKLKTINSTQGNNNTEARTSKGSGSGGGKQQSNEGGGEQMVDTIGNGDEETEDENLMIGGLIKTRK